MPEPRFFGSLALCHVDARSYITRKRTILTVSRYSDIKNPTRFPVMPSQAILHFETFATIKRLCVGFKASLNVILVDTFRPSVSDFLCASPTCEIQPRLIEVCAKFVRIRHPNHYGSRICD